MDCCRKNYRRAPLKNPPWESQAAPAPARRFYGFATEWSRDAREVPVGAPPVYRGKFTLAFVGYGDESNHTVVELTHNWDTKSYDLGNGFGHVAVAVPDAYKACEAVKAQGGKVTREAGPMKFGGSVIAFVEDPDGYKIEFIQRA